MKMKKRLRQLGRIEREVLDDLSAGDLLYGFLLSARSTRRMYRLARERANERYRRKRAIERLIDCRFIQKQGERLSLTVRGKHALANAVAQTANMLQNKTWDGEWRVVVYDIPERYAALRNRVRRILKKAGFAQLQMSVWVFPHECHELVQLIQEESALSKHILYGTLRHVEGEGRLKKIFRLT